MYDGNTKKRRKRQKQKKILEAIMTDSFPKLVSDTNPQIQETETLRRIKQTNKQTKSPNPTNK